MIIDLFTNFLINSSNTIYATCLFVLDTNHSLSFCVITHLTHPTTTVKYLDFLRKRCNVNPNHGPHHYRAPSKIFWRTVRGMLPHKTPRGEECLGRLRVCEGIPPPYDQKKRFVVPSALRVLKLNHRRKVCFFNFLHLCS